MTPWQSMAVTVLCSVLASGGLWSFIQWKMEQKVKRNSAETQALIALLHDRIYDISKKALTDGKITHEDYKNLMCLWEPYKALKGNHGAKKLIEEVDKLPLVGEVI